MIASVDRSQKRVNRRRGGEVIELLDARVPTWDRNFARVAFEERWIQNCAYFAGKQHFALMGNQLVEVPPGQHEIRYRVNYVKPAVLRSVSKLLNMHGRFSVAPKNGSPRAREISRTSERVLDHQRTTVDYENEKLMVYLWAAVCGTAFLRNLWDPNQGEPDRYYKFSAEEPRVIPEWAMTGEEKNRRDRERLFDDVAPGEIDSSCVSPFQVHEDPASKGRMKDCRYISTSAWVERGVIAEAFDVDEDDLEPDSNSAASMRWDESLAYMTTGTSGYGSGFYTPTDERNERCHLRLSWERPSRKNKHGRFIAAAGDLVLADVPNPYIGDRSKSLHLPFSKFDWIPALGRFWGYALVDDLTSPQFRYNESRARMFEFERIFGRPNTFVPKGSGIPTGELALNPGQVYEYSPSVGTIVFAPAPTLPKEVADNSVVSRREIAELSAGSDIDAKNLPASLRSGEAVQQMVQERDIILNVTAQSALRFELHNGRQFLGLGQLFYDNERTALYRGPNGSYGVQAYRAADLSNELKIFGEPGTVETLQQTRALILDAVQARALQPDIKPEDARRVVKAMRFNTSEEGIDDLLMHEAKQEAELRDMIANPERYRNAPFPIMPFEDHPAHQLVIVRFYHSDEWGALDQFTQSVILSHWQQHEQFRQQQIAQMMALQEAARGAPGAKGQASQPAG